MSNSAGHRWAWPLFLVFAYGITWAMQIPAYLYLVPRGIAPTNEANFLLLGASGPDPGTTLAVILLCFSFGPSVAGVVVTAWESGRPGLRDLFARMVKTRIPGKWIVFVLLFPVVLSVAALALGWVMGGMTPLDYSGSTTTPAACSGSLSSTGTPTHGSHTSCSRPGALPHRSRTASCPGSSPSGC